MATKGPEQVQVWERFAEEDAHHYICTELRRGDAGAFWQSGEETVDREILPLAARYSVYLGTAVEFGCGVGRLAFPLARHFQQVIGLDLSAAMVAQADATAAERGVGNAAFLRIEHPERLCDELHDLKGRVNFVYSLLVFQHIDDFRVIEAYLRWISRLLSPEGIGYLHFDTRPKSPLYYAKTFLPDALLPRNWRRGIRRVRRNSAEIESCLARHSLTIVESIAPHTALHRYVIRPGA